VLGCQRDDASTQGVGEGIPDNDESAGALTDRGVEQAIELAGLRNIQGLNA
jgi:hypothetical protein